MAEIAKSNPPPPRQLGRPPKGDGKALSKVLPTDRVAVEKQIEIARAFAIVFKTNGGSPVANEDAGAALTPELAGATVLTTNSFFVDIGLLSRAEQGGGFIPCQALQDYIRLLQWDAESAEEKLQSFFKNTWFYSCLETKLLFTSQAKTACLAILATESNAGKEHEQRLQYLLDFLNFVKAITVTGDVVSLPSLFGKARNTDQPVKEKKQLPTTYSGVPEKMIAQEGEGTHTYVLPLDKENKRKITVQAPLDVTAKEVQRISKWLEVSLLIDQEADKM